MTIERVIFPGKPKCIEDDVWDELIHKAQHDDLARRVLGAIPTIPEQRIPSFLLAVCLASGEHLHLLAKQVSALETRLHRASKIVEAHRAYLRSRAAGPG